MYKLLSVTEWNVSLLSSRSFSQCLSTVRTWLATGDVAVAPMSRWKLYITSSNWPLIPISIFSSPPMLMSISQDYVSSLYLWPNIQSSLWVHSTLLSRCFHPCVKFCCHHHTTLLRAIFHFSSYLPRIYHMDWPWNPYISEFLQKKVVPWEI